MLGTIFTILIILFVLAVIGWVLRGVLWVGGGCLKFIFSNVLWLLCFIIFIMVILALIAG